ncbi:MAG: hypothetical protein ACTSYD_03435 [Candidatus Heimdallarchaeaceae archaeon]
MKALVVLTQSECKKLLAVGIKDHPLIVNSLQNGKIYIARGSTNAYIVEELTGKSINKARYVAGQVTGDKNLERLSGLSSEKRLKEIVIEEGKPREITDPIKELENFEPENDVIIKGGNVLGMDGLAGVYMSHPRAGTIGNVLPIAISRGIPIIVPISLAKLAASSVWELSQLLGNQLFEEKYVMGHPIGIMPIPGEVITEIEALEILYPNITAVHIGSSGVGDAEGSVHLYLEGEEEDIEKAFDELTNLIAKTEHYQPELN